MHVWEVGLTSLLRLTDFMLSSNAEHDSQLKSLRIVLVLALILRLKKSVNVNLFFLNEATSASVAKEKHYREITIFYKTIVPRPKKKRLRLYFFNNAFANF